MEFKTLDEMLKDANSFLQDYILTLHKNLYKTIGISLVKEYQGLVNSDTN